MVEVKLYFKIRELKRWSRQKPSKYTQIHIKIAEKREREKNYWSMILPMEMKLIKDPCAEIIVIWIAG